jgi:hypothetical protein
MLAGALPTDLRLYSEAADLVQYSPRSCLCLDHRCSSRRDRAANYRQGRRSCLQDRSRTLASSIHPCASSTRPRTLSTGGMSYGMLPSGARGLIRSLRVSTLAHRQDIASLPTMRLSRTGVCSCDGCAYRPDLRGERNIAVSPPVRTYGSYGCPDCYAVLAIRPGTESMPYQRWMGAVYRTVGSGNNVGHRIVLSPGNTTE